MECNWVEERVGGGLSCVYGKLSAFRADSVSSRERGEAGDTEICQPNPSARAGRIIVRRGTPL